MFFCLAYLHTALLRRILHEASTSVSLPYKSLKYCLIRRIAKYSAVSRLPYRRTCKAAVESSSLPLLSLSPSFCEELHFNMLFLPDFKSVLGDKTSLTFQLYLLIILVTRSPSCLQILCTVTEIKRLLYH